MPILENNAGYQDGIKVRPRICTLATKVAMAPKRLLSAGWTRNYSKMAVTLTWSCLAKSGQRAGVSKRQYLRRAELYHDDDDPG